MELFGTLFGCLDCLSSQALLGGVAPSHFSGGKMPNFKPQQTEVLPKMDYDEVKANQSDWYGKTAGLPPAPTQPSSMKNIASRISRIQDALINIAAELRGAGDSVFGPGVETPPNLINPSPSPEYKPSGLIETVMLELDKLERDVATVRHLAQRFGAL